MLSSDPLIVGAAIAVFIIAIFSDLKRRRISNFLVLVVFTLAIARIEIVRPASALADVEAAGIVLVLTFALYLIRWMGAGDAKLVSAGTLLVGAAASPHFLVLTVALGGALGLLALVDARIGDISGWSAGLAHPFGVANAGAGEVAMGATRKASVPYGVAIALAAVATLLGTPRF